MTKHVPLGTVFMLTLLVSSAFAADKSTATQLPSQGKHEVSKYKCQTQRDPHSFCWHADLAYSEGAVVDGRECARLGADVFERAKQPLGWQPQQNSGRAK